MKRRIDLALVLALTVPVAFTALGLRDLSGEEVVFYFGLGPLGIFRQALDPAGEGAFHAHQPLSYLVRWVVLTIAGEVTPTTLRIHSAGFAVAGAVATWWVAGRAGNRVGAVVAGLVVGWSPVLAFHAHEASGYAATPLFGALAISGLIDLRSSDARVRNTGGALLFAGVVGGMANDFFFGFALLATAAITPWKRREARWAWAAATAVLFPAAAVFTRSLARLEAPRRLGPHVDPAPGEVSVLGEIAEAAQGVVEGFLHGYSRALEAWELAGFACVVVVLVAASAVIGGLLGRRTPVEGQAVAAAAAMVPGVAGAFAVGTVVLGGLASAGLQASTGTEFTTAPRAFLAVLPAMGVLVGTVALRRPGWVGLGLTVAVGLGIACVQSIGTARTVLDPPRGVLDATARLRSEARQGDYLFGTAVHRVAVRALPEGVAVDTSFDGCLGGPEELARHDRVWVIADRAVDVLPGCAGPIDLAAAGFARTLLDQHTLPTHEAWSPAYLPEVHLTRWDRATPALDGPFIRWIALPRELPRGRSIRLRLDLPDGVVRYRQTRPTTGPARLALRVPEGTLATPTLVGPGGEAVLSWGPRLLTQPRSEQVWTLRMPPAAGRDGLGLRLLGFSLALWLVSAVAHVAEASRRSWGTKGSPPPPQE